MLLDPKLAAVYYNLGVALADKGHLDEAISCYREALRINPEDAGAHFNLGNALAAKGQLDEAVVALVGFIRWAPPEYAEHVEKLKAAIGLKGL